MRIENSRLIWSDIIVGLFSRALELFMGTVCRNDSLYSLIPEDEQQLPSSLIWLPRSVQSVIKKSSTPDLKIASESLRP